MPKHSDERTVATMAYGARKLENLRTTILGKNFLHFETLPSTNDYLKMEGSNLPHGTVVMSAAQTAGRGREDHKFICGKDEGLYMSVLFKPRSVANLTLLPLIAGVAVTRAMDKLCALPTGLKWPNDVLYDGRKLAGILCEGKLFGEDINIICGIGLNVLQSNGFFEEHNLLHATSLYIITGANPKIADVAALILNELEPMYERLALGDINPLIEEYKKSCVSIGRKVTATSFGERKTGIAVDIDANGALVVNCDGNIVTVNAGDVEFGG